MNQQMAGHTHQTGSGPTPVLIPKGTTKNSRGQANHISQMSQKDHVEEGITLSVLMKTCCYANRSKAISLPILTHSLGKAPRTKQVNTIDCCHQAHTKEMIPEKSTKTCCIASSKKKDTFTWISCG
jgi:hypothetical protein